MDLVLVRLVYAMMFFLLVSPLPSMSRLVQFSNQFKLHRHRFPLCLHSFATDVHANLATEFKKRFSEVNNKLTSTLSKQQVGYEPIVNAVKDLEQTSMQPGFWDNQEYAQKILGELNRQKTLLSRFDSWHSQREDIEMLADIAIEDPDQAGTIE
jgi:hypothetical protein